MNNTECSTLFLPAWRRSSFPRTSPSRAWQSTTLSTWSTVVKWNRSSSPRETTSPITWRSGRRKRTSRSDAAEQDEHGRDVPSLSVPRLVTNIWRILSCRRSFELRCTNWPWRSNCWNWARSRRFLARRSSNRRWTPWPKRRFLSNVSRESRSFLYSKKWCLEMQALDDHGELTALGRLLARFPVEPKMGKMLILACLFGSVTLISSRHNIHRRSMFDVRWISLRCPHSIDTEVFHWRCKDNRRSSERAEEDARRSLERLEAKSVVRRSSPNVSDRRENRDENSPCFGSRRLEKERETNKTPLTALSITSDHLRSRFIGFSVGDAACTIASATSFSEPFLHDGKYLRHMHRNLAGNRFSDHVALLNAFQHFEREKFDRFFLLTTQSNVFFFQTSPWRARRGGILRTEMFEPVDDAHDLRSESENSFVSAVLRRWVSFS